MCPGRRRKDRGTENTEIINLRVSNARKELLRKNDFNYLIINDDIENAYEKLASIIEQILKK